MPNTQYFVYAYEEDNYGNTSPNSLSLSTITAPGIFNPGGGGGGGSGSMTGGLTNIDVLSMVANWQANGNPSGTQYYIEVSSISMGGPPLHNSGDITASIWYSTGLSPNTYYYFRGKSINSISEESAWTVIGSSYTKSAIPGSPTTSDVDISSLTVSWTSANNPPGTFYVLQQSSINAGNWVKMYDGTQSSTSIQNLSPNTRYYYRVCSTDAYGTTSNFSGMDNDTTLCRQPQNVVSTASFTSVGTNSLSFTWNPEDNPSWTGYVAEESNDASNWNVLTGTYTYNFTDSQGLSPNNTYYFRLRAVNNVGIYTGYTPTISSHTLSAIPATFKLVSVSSSAISTSWTANNNANGTTYEFECSRDSITWFTVQQGPLLQGTTSSLLTNTTYYMKVRSINVDGVPSSYTNIITAETSAAIPDPPTIIAVSSITVQLSLTQSVNPAQTTYAIKVTSGTSTFWVQSNTSLGGSPIYQSTATWGNVVVTTLSPNLLYSFSLAAESSDDDVTSYSTAVSTWTKAAPPVAGPFVVSSTTITANWTANGNPGGTQYTSSDTIRGTSYSTIGSSWPETGLTPNTTYTYEVLATNNNGVNTTYTPLGSTVTLAAVPPAPSITSVGYSSETISINVGANPYPTQYAISISSNSGLWSVFLSTVAGVFSPTAVYFTTDTWSSPSSNIPVINLSTNTLYTYSVSAENMVNETTAFGNSASSATLALNAITFSIQTVMISSVTLTWTSDNPGTTRFEVYDSTDNFATNFSTPVPLSKNLTDTTTTVMLLTPDTTYSFRIRPFNQDGVPASYSSILTTTTYAATPFYNQFTINTTSITVKWNGNGNPSDTVYVSSNITLSSSVITTVTFWNDTGLTPNTTYQYQLYAAGKNGTNTTPISTTVVTAAAVPDPPALDNVQISSICITISTGPNNPYYTQYALQISSAGGWSRYLSTSSVISLTPVFADTMTWTSQTWVSGLFPNTTYTFTVEAENNQQVLTAFSVALTTPTLANIPVVSTFIVTSTSITARWTSNGNSPGTMYISSETLTPTASYSTTGSSWPDTGLTPNTTYAYQVEAENYAGIPTGWVVLGTTMTLAQIPPQMGVTDVAITSMSVHINTGLTQRSLIRDGIFAIIAKLSGCKTILVIHGWKEQELI